MNTVIDPKWERRVAVTMNAVAIGATAGIVFISGILYGEYHAPKPCVPNLATPKHLSILNLQPLLDDVAVYPPDSAFAQAGIPDSRAFAYRLVDKFNQDGEHLEEIYTNPVTKEEFWIPSRCYAVIDSMGDPVLYRK